MDPDLDLTLRRVIRAPREVVWRAWADPILFAQWWIPAPTVCRVEHLDLRPGGALVTSMSEDGTMFVPHLDATFLVVEEFDRLVYTNAVDSQWRPAAPEPFVMAAEVAFADHPEGTDYRVVVRHGDPISRARHEELGFAEGWGAVAVQLAAVAEREAGG